MKVFTAEKIKEIDAYTIEHEPVAHLDLMERAAAAVLTEITKRWSVSQRMVLFAGSGNNGGDALAVSRMLLEMGYKVETYLFNTRNDLTSSTEVNRDRLLQIPDVNFTEVHNTFVPPLLDNTDVVIDGLFGTGLHDKLAGGYKALVDYVNESEAYVVSIDMPSGMLSEYNDGMETRFMMHASLTLAFQLPHLAFFFPENSRCIGEWKLLNIGLSQEAIATFESDVTLVEREFVASKLMTRNEFTEKHDYGHALLVTGSYGMMGSSVIASRACMRSGAGMLTVNIPNCGYQIMQTAVPEAMVSTDINENYITDINIQHRYAAVGAGPGLGIANDTITAVELMLKQLKTPCVLDADALNCIAKRQSLMSLIPKDSILTPHAREFDRLFGSHIGMEQRYATAIDKAKELGVIIVLKGHYTFIVLPNGKTYINTTGNPGMATAGSGDVLTGIITGLLAQGYTPEVSAIIGVYIHGMAADMAAISEGEEGLIAGDIAANVGKAIKNLCKNNIKEIKI